MNIQFNKLYDIKEFAKLLSSELIKLGYNDRAKMVDEFSYNSYTTSSEYLGEFRFLLEDLINENIFIENNMKLQVAIAIKTINKAFSN